ncbi:MAG: HAD family hydrolase [Armatimonadetes bacterium]|nr:HAD family hydrolase [Armatimonadota bacterium]
MPRMSPELVIFDYDGVLCRAEAYTPDALRVGLRRFHAATGIEPADPDDETLLKTLGYAAAQAYPRLLPEAVRHLWPLLHQLTLDAMEERIRALGAAAWYPGAAQLLDDLLAGGRILVLASNSSERYQRVHGEVHGLARWFRHLYHAQMPGIASKADMVARALIAEPGADGAVMVGDRASDRDAARAHGVPFIACVWGHGNPVEWAGAAAQVADLTALRAALGL